MAVEEFPDYRQGTGRIEAASNFAPSIDVVPKVKPSENDRTKTLVTKYAQRNDLPDEETRALLEILGLT